MKVYGNQWIMFGNQWKIIQINETQLKSMDIKKTTKTLGGRDVKSLEEEIENSITIHWLVIHRDKLEEYIANTIF